MISRAAAGAAETVARRDDRSSWFDPDAPRPPQRLHANVTQQAGHRTDNFLHYAPPRAGTCGCNPQPAVGRMSGHKSSSQLACAVWLVLFAYSLQPGPGSYAFDRLMPTNIKPVLEALYGACVDGFLRAFFRCDRNHYLAPLGAGCEAE